MKYGHQEVSLTLIVVEGTGIPLFGQNWMEKVKINWESIKKLSRPEDQLICKHGLLIQGLGTLKGMQASLM